MEIMKRPATENLIDTDAPIQIEIERDISPDYQQDYKEQT